MFSSCPASRGQHQVESTWLVIGVVKNNVVWKKRYLYAKRECDREAETNNVWHEEYDPRAEPWKLFDFTRNQGEEISSRTVLCMDPPMSCDTKGLVKNGPQFLVPIQQIIWGKANSELVNLLSYSLYFSSRLKHGQDCGTIDSSKCCSWDCWNLQALGWTGGVLILFSLTRWFWPFVASHLTRCKSMHATYMTTSK